MHKPTFEQPEQPSAKLMKQFAQHSEIFNKLKHQSEIQLFNFETQHKLYKSAKQLLTTIQQIGRNGPSSTKLKKAECNRVVSHFDEKLRPAFQARQLVYQQKQQEDQKQLTAEEEDYIDDIEQLSKTQTQNLLMRSQISQQSLEDSLRKSEKAYKNEILRLNQENHALQGQLQEAKNSSLDNSLKITKTMDKQRPKSAKQKQIGFEELDEFFEVKYSEKQVSDWLLQISYDLIGNSKKLDTEKLQTQMSEKLWRQCSYIFQKIQNWRDESEATSSAFEELNYKLTQLSIIVAKSQREVMDFVQVVQAQQETEKADDENAGIEEELQQNDIRLELQQCINENLKLNDVLKVRDQQLFSANEQIQVLTNKLETIKALNAKTRKEVQQNERNVGASLPQEGSFV